MIDTLLTKIAGFFDKAFLFASFFPALIFVTALGLILSGIIGYDAVSAWVDSWTGAKKTGIVVAGSIGLLLFSYLLNALQSTFVRWWSGDITKLFLPLWWIVSLGKAFQTYRYRRFYERSFATSSWGFMWKSFMDSVENVYDKNHPQPNTSDVKELRNHMAKLHELMSPASAQVRLDAIVEAYKKFSGEALGEQVYRPLKLKLEEFMANDEDRQRAILVVLDREFGNLQTMHATRLGNVIEAYSQYASKRYEIEMDVFWPHLRSVVPEAFLNLMGDQKILLDFSLAMATLGAGFAFLSIAIGPWLWYQPVVWIPLACFGAVITGMFYRLGVTAAEAYGGFLRASFDLYRLDLMKALQRSRPTSLMEERKQWRQLSKLAIYNDPADFPLRAEETK